MINTWASVGVSRLFESTHRWHQILPTEQAGRMAHRELVRDSEAIIHGDSEGYLQHSMFVKPMLSKDAGEILHRRQYATFPHDESPPSK